MRILRCSPKNIYSFDYFKDQLIYDFDGNMSLLLNQMNIGRLDAWSTYLNQDGFWCKELIVDSKKLQLQWQQEFIGDATTDMQEILFNQIAYYKADVVFAHAYEFFTIEIIKKIRDRFPKLKLLTGDGTGHYNFEYARLFDVVLYNIKEIGDQYKSHGFHSLHIPYGINLKKAEKFDSLKFQDRKDKLLFAGSVVRNLHKSRKKVICHLARRLDDFDIATKIDNIKKADYTYDLEKKLYKYLGIFNNSNRRCYANIQEKYIGHKTGQEYIKLLSLYKLILNVHIDTISKHGGNIRFLEIAFVGGAVLTDPKENLDELLGKDTYFVFKSKQECLYKTQYLLKNPSLMEEKASKMRDYIFDNYSYEKIFDTFREQLLGL